MPRALTGLAKDKLEKAERLAKRLTKFNENLPTFKIGSAQHKIAKERLLYLLVQEQEKIAKALIRKALEGDVNAINSVLDRLYGKSKETIDFGGTVQFSLKALALKRQEMQSTLVGAVQDNKPIVISHEEIKAP